jgi:hypothetical protein
MGLRRSTPRPQERRNDLQLVEDAGDVRQLELLRGENIKRQADWREDRSFLEGFRRGDEIAWSGVDEFEAERAKYLRHIQHKRRGLAGRVGERKLKKYGAAAAWSSLRWPLFLGLLLVFLYFGQRNGFWLPRDPNDVVWLNAEDRAALLAGTPTPASVVVGRQVEAAPAGEVVDLGLPAGDVEGRRVEVEQDAATNPIVARRQVSSWANRLKILAYSVLLFWLIRRVGGRRRRAAPAVVGRQEVVIRLDLAPE